MEPKDKDRILKGALDLALARLVAGYEVMDYAVHTQGYLQQQPGVERVLDYRHSDITVRFEDKSQVTILLGREASYGGPPAASNAALPGKAPGYSNPNGLRAGVIDPLWDDWPPQATPTGIVNTLLAEGFQVEHIKGQDVDLEFMTEFDNHQYRVVFIRTHGGTIWIDNDPKLHIMVRPFFDSWPPDSGFVGISTFYVNTKWGPRYAYAFNDAFVSTHMNEKRFPNTLMHLLVCYGASVEAENDMIPALLNLGVGCYTGWTLTASSTYGDPAAVTFFERMRLGDTVAEAIQHIEAAGSSPDPSTGALLVAHGDGDMHLHVSHIGNKRTKKLHQPECRWARAMNPENIQRFDSIAEALTLGYQGCRSCLPGHDPG